MLNRYQEAMEKIMAKYSSGIREAEEKNMIPYKSEQGHWVASPFDGNSWWTGGFYPALMWQFRAAGGDGRFLAEALRVEKLLTDEFRRPAIKTYLRLGFRPWFYKDDMPERWAGVFRDMGLPAADYFAYDELSHRKVAIPVD